MQIDQTPVRLNDRRFLEGGEITIDSDAVKTVDVYGRYFMVRSASNEFEMRVHNSQWFPIDQGEGFDLGDEDRFNKLSFRRKAGDNSTIRLNWRTSDCLLFDTRLSIVRDPLHLGTLDVQRGRTFAMQFMPTSASTPGYTILIPALSGVPIPGLFNVDGLASPFQITPSNERDFKLQWTRPATTGLVVRQSLRIQVITTTAADAPLDVIMIRNWGDQTTEDLLFATYAGMADFSPVAKIYPSPTASAGLIIPNNSNVFYTEDSQTYILRNRTASAVQVDILAVYDKPLEFRWPGP